SLSLGALQALLDPVSLTAQYWDRGLLQQQLDPIRSSLEDYFVKMEHAQLKSQNLVDQVNSSALLVPALRRVLSGGASSAYLWLQELEQQLWLRDLRTSFTDRR